MVKRKKSVAISRLKKKNQRLIPTEDVSPGSILKRISADNIREEIGALSNIKNTSTQCYPKR